MNLQALYDVRLAELKAGKEINDLPRWPGASRKDEQAGLA
jgi:hypothetical protein